MSRVRTYANSISVRLLTGATVLIAIGLIIVGLIVVRQVRTYSETIFDQDLAEKALALITAADFDENGAIVFNAPFRGQRFHPPFSGWYWQIYLDGKTVSKSRSLWDQSLALDETLSNPDGDIRQFTGPRAEALRAIQVTSQVDSGNMVVLVAGNERQMRGLQRNIIKFLLIMTPVVLLIFLVITLLQIRYGLRPLHQVTEDLRALRDGDTQNLGETGKAYPREIEPLATEINSLQNANRELVERARRQVGNLAHAIKTPLAVMRNAADTDQSDLAQKALEQALQIQDQIDRHMTLARSAATSQRAGTLIDVGDIALSLQAALEKIHADKNPHIELDIDPDSGLRGDKADLMEMLGNLMDNAAKWCKSRVHLTVKRDGNQIIIAVEDDGPGIPENRRAEALQRGKRLDERTPGTGLGLSIVSDMAEIHGGTLRLCDSELGGLCAELVFKA
ncbi:MAG: ATP-binding protein [Alphaproteobacteria bacterium]